MTTTPYTRNLVLRHALDIAAGHGVAPATLLTYCGLDEAAATRDHGLLPTAMLIEVIEHAAALTQRRDFGLAWGARADYRSFGSLGIAVAHQPTLGEAMAGVGAYFRHLNLGFHFTLADDADVSSMRFSLDVRTGREPRHYREGMALLLVRFGRLLSAGAWQPRLLRLPHARISGAYAYEKAFGCPVQFSQADMEIVSDRAAFAAPLRFEDTPVHTMMQRVIAGPRSQANHALAARVAAILPMLLPSGSATAGHVADILGLSARTLQRRLEAEGTSFRAVLAGLREDIVRQHVEMGFASGATLAAALGFSEPSAASRFIRARLGCTTRDLAPASSRAA